MKKNLLIFGMLAACCSGTLMAQSKINGLGRLAIESYMSTPKARSVAAPEVLALVTVANPADIDVLKGKGYKVSSVVENMAMVNVAIDRVEELASLPQVESVSFGNESRPYLDQARIVSNVDVINDGSGDGLAGHSYTGKGVTVGLYDTGLDPNHASFRNADGSTRVKGIYVRRETTSSNQDITDPAEIAKFTTENNQESHGTHVLGIIAGSNDATGTYAGGAKGAIPYYGPAYEADLLIGCGDFTDNAILAGVDTVVKKGKELGQPVVVNLSLGSNTGSHDPNSDRSKFLDALGKDAIICISAGNEGELPMSVSRKFSSFGANKTLNTFIVPQTTSTTGPTSKIAYTAEFWCDTDEAFNCNLVVYDKSSGRVVQSIPVEADNTARLTGDAMGSQYDSSSYVSGVGGVNKSTNRYNVQLVGVVKANQLSTYCVGVNVTASNGRTVVGYVNTLRSSEAEAVFSSENVSGYVNGTPNGTINGFGCGYNMISVGAYVSRTSAPYVGSGAYAGGGTTGDIASFSSYGTTADGRKLPHVCAPGAQVVSAVSTYWMKSVMNDAINNNRVCAVSNSFDREHYWYPMQGTSMSSPFVAGVVALWAQAWPEMNVQQCLDIIEKTSIKDNYTNSSVGQNLLRWGAGKIDALAGLKMAIDGKASLGNVAADDNGMNLIIQNLGGRNYEVSYVNADDIAVEVYSVQGAKVLAAAADGDTLTFDASGLADGIYVVNVATPAGNVARKFVVK